MRAQKAVRVTTIIEFFHVPIRVQIQIIKRHNLGSEHHIFEIVLSRGEYSVKYRSGTIETWNERSLINAFGLSNGNLIIEHLES